MNKLNFPSFEFKIKKENKNRIIFDEIRKKWIILTPEELVRQNFIKLIISKNYPKSFASFDVFEVEPAFDNKLLTLENFFATSHRASLSIDGILSMGRAAIRGLIKKWIKEIYQLALG